MYILEVLVEYATHSLDRPFTYLSKEFVPQGVRVQVIFNRRRLVGYVLNVSQSSQSLKALEETYGYKLSFINNMIDYKPLLNEELLSLSKVMSQMTLTPLIGCLQTMLPGHLKPHTRTSIKAKTQKAVKVISQQKASTIKQNEALAYLKQEGIHFLKDVPYSRELLKKLEQQQLITIYDQEVRRNPYQEINQEYQEVTLTPQQQAVVEGILHKEERISLIHGVTGSGKTEVYIALTKAMLKVGKNVIMLVPEISLTPMMVEAFKRRFQDQVAILHSRLSQGERYDEYRRISNQEVRIVVGARSAVFAPLDNIGLIIMDEEHDTSYKQENNPRYHTLQIAKWRMHYHHARVVLGSATPSLESYARACKGSYDLYQLKERINKKPMPHVDIVDMSLETKAKNYSHLSRLMKSRLQKTIDEGRQAIILLNKRGYASFIKCMDCDEVIRCPHCDVTLTYHKKENILKCHYCDYSMPVVKECPSCHSQNIKKIGYGTQKIEEELNASLIGAKVIRFDYDTTRNKNDHTRLLTSFENREGNILLGTQMIAKGLNFSNVTFVGVLMADITLTLPDFRASERTFQLLCQVAGRSGRGDKSGEVVIQTYNPDHYAITLAAKHDYEAFYQKEMAFRHSAKYPPYCHLLSIIVQSKSQKDVHVASLDIKEYLKTHLSNVKILGPSQATVYKMQDIYRERVLVKYIQSAPVYKVLAQLNQYYNIQQKGRITMICDFNPYSSV